MSSRAKRQNKQLWQSRILLSYHIWLCGWVCIDGVQTWRGSRRCRSRRACRRSRAAVTTGWGSSHQGPRRCAPRRLQSRWSTLGPCALVQTSHQSLMSDCPPVWFSWSGEAEKKSIEELWHCFRFAQKPDSPECTKTWIQKIHITFKILKFGRNCIQSNSAINILFTYTILVTSCIPWESNPLLA